MNGIGMSIKEALECLFAFSTQPKQAIFEPESEPSADTESPRTFT